MIYEIRVSNIPYGAYTEWYLGTDVCKFASRKEAEEIVRQFEISRDAHPEDFEPGMEAEIIDWPDDDLNEDDDDEDEGERINAHGNDEQQRG